MATTMSHPNASDSVSNPATLPPVRAAAPFSPQIRRAPLFLPRSITHPSVLLWVWLLPQIALIAVNLHAWHFISGEVDGRQHTMATSIFAGQAVLLLAGAIAMAWLWKRGQHLTRWHGILLAALPAIYLGYVFTTGQQAIPASVADWIVPRGQWVFKQFALLMPAVLFGGFRLACPTHENESNSGMTALVGALLISLTCVAISFAGNIFLPMLVALNSAGTTAAWIVFSSVLAAMVLRVCVSSYIAARRSGPFALAGVTSLIAIIGPLGGLALNATIPFPVDLQSPLVYALVLVNGFVLALPNFAAPWAHRTVWITQCAFLPFSAYFFILFLPYVPLAPLAMILLGLGTLILVPSALFLLHGYRILDGLRAEIRDGRPGVPIALAAAAILAGPAIFAMTARADRSALHQALDHLTYADYRNEKRYEGDLTALRRSLHRMHEFKNGFHFPLISELTNWLTFDNLTLPQSRLEALHHTFIGEPLPEFTRRGEIGLFGTRRPRPSVAESFTSPEETRPTQNARIERLTVTTHSQSGITRTHATLNVGNPTGTTTEFHTTLHVPPGVHISGMWLTVGSERVPARVFEQRAAEWVYQKITEVRPVPRDPAILRYLDAQTADLRVYPVEPNQPRTVEIEFSHPEGTAPAIRIGNQALVSDSPPIQTTVAITGNGHAAIVIPAAITADLPVITRRPHLHFIADLSAGSSLSDPSRLRAAIRDASSNFPGVDSLTLTFANFESVLFRDGVRFTWDEFDALPDAALIAALPPARGGFLPTRAVKSVLLETFDQLNSGSLPGTAPLIVVLRGSETSSVEESDDDLERFAELVPDIAGYWIHPSRGGPLSTVDFRKTDDVSPTPSAVRLFRLGGLRFLGAASGTVAFTTFEALRGTTDALEVFNAASDAFEIVPGVGFVTDPRFAAGIDTWSAALARMLTPARRGPDGLVHQLALNRASGVLTPAVNFIVVENSAQWKMLEATEQRVFGGHGALALTESPAVTPEPGTIVLLAAALLVVFGRKIIRSRRLRFRPEL